MKKSILLIFVLSFFAFQSYAQKAEVLFFKANLACCAAKACANIENQVKAVVENNFKSSEVVFRTIMLADSANAALVQKHNAKSQTVIIVPLKKKKAVAKDVSIMVRDFSRTKDEAAFEKDLMTAIKELL